MPTSLPALRCAVLLPLLFAGCAPGSGGWPMTAASPSRPLAARIADAMLAAGDAPAALHVADGMVAADPADVEAHLRRGRALALLGRPGEAADEFDIVAKQLPVDLQNLEALAAARASAGDSIAAERAWRLVLQQRAADPRAVDGLAVALDLQERHSEAQALYQQALRARPGDLAAATNLGLSLALSGHPREAVIFLERPGVVTQGARAKHDLAVALVLAGDEAGARAMLREDMGEAEVAAAIAGIRELARS